MPSLISPTFLAALSLLSAVGVGFWWPGEPLGAWVLQLAAPFANAGSALAMAGGAALACIAGVTVGGLLRRLAVGLSGYVPVPPAVDP